MWMSDCGFQGWRMWMSSAAAISAAVQSGLVGGDLSGIGASPLDCRGRWLAGEPHRGRAGDAGRDGQNSTFVRVGGQRLGREPVPRRGDVECGEVLAAEAAGG